MRAFFVRQLDENEELCPQLDRAENDLVATQKTVADRAMLLKEVEEEREMAKTEACRVKKEKKVVEAKCKDAKQAKDLLKKELEELWAIFVA